MTCADINKVFTAEVNKYLERGYHFNTATMRGSQGEIAHMKALKIEPGKAPERIDVANELASLQSLVGGYIEVIYPDERRPVGLICNEEGKCCGLELNRALYQNGKPYDIIAGTFLVVGLSAEDFTDLREEDAAYFEKLFRSPEKFQRFAGRLVISKVVPGGV